MYIPAKIVVLVGLIISNLYTKTPWVSTIFYTGVVFLFGFSDFGFSIPLFLTTGISFGISFAYFWALKRLERNWLFWGLVLIIGSAILISI